MNFFSQNIRYLRKTRKMTQDDLAIELDIKRSLIGSYEENRAMPKIQILRKIAAFFRVTIDDMVSMDLQKRKPSKDNLKGDRLRVLTTVVSEDNRELITVVPVKASAGYLNGYADPEYVEQLPRFNMPLPELGPERTYRVFQTKGDSMLPVPSGAYIFCEYMQNWNELNDGKTYVLVTLDEGVVYKRVHNRIKESNELLLESDNPDYDPYTVPVKNVIEVWRALGFLSFDLPEPGDVDMLGLSSIVLKMRRELDALKKEEN